LTLVERSFQEGILPVTRSKRDYVPRSDYRYEFLAGNGREGKNCGKWMTRGCLDVEDHSAATFSLDGVGIGGKEEVEFYKSSCGRLACPVCYEKAAAKEALKIEHRIRSFKIVGRNLKPVHVVVSPPVSAVATSDFEELKRGAFMHAKACGVIGGSLIFHHLRKEKEDDFKEDLAEGFSYEKSPASWYFSPHFHIIGYGWISRTKENYKTSGWVVKNLGVRKSVRATALYQLSHCAVSPNYHTVVWFGALAYNKMKCLPLSREKHECTQCGKKYRKVVFIDAEMERIVKSSLEKEGIYYCDVGLFRYADEQPRAWDGG
jgi:hypothetical protein